MVDPGPEKREVLPHGTVVARRFRIDRLLGAGGMASVYRAQDMSDGHFVALKLLRKDLCATPEAITRFRREGELLTALAHPSIVRIESYGEAGDGSLFLAMELLEGETLGQLLRREHVIEASELAPLLAGAAAGLIAAHAKNVIHRDLKPDNIFLARTADSNDVHVKLLDFGISKVFGSEKLTMTGQVLGTPRYMSPEQLSAEGDLDTRVDIYALGVILYEAIAGQPPFLATNPSDLLVAILHGDAVPLRAVKRDANEAVAGVVMRAMSRLPQARFSKVVDLVDAYLQAVGHEAVKKPVRPGMPTRLVGSFGYSEPPAPKSASFKNDEIGFAGALKPGTLAQLPQAPAPLPQVHAPEAKAQVRSPAMPATLHQDPDMYEAPARASHAHAQPSPAVRASQVHGAPPERAGAANVSPDPSVNIPMQGNQSFVLVVAIVAGALSAALAIFGLSYCGKDQREQTMPSLAVAVASPTDAGPAPDAGLAVAPSALVAPIASADAGAVPVGADPPRATSERSERRRERRSEQNVAPADDRVHVTPTAPPASNEPTGLDLLNQARDAQRASNFDSCVDLARQALAHGAPSAALRLQGDCLRRSGHNAEALAAYQRFCRVAPDHPAISEVRALAEGMGGTCP